MAGPNLKQMAWRNLWRHRRRTSITLFSLAFGIMLATLFTGMSDWRWTAVIDLAARMGGGHITIQHPDYLDRPSFKRTVRPPSHAQIEAPGIRRIVPRITGQAMLATAGHNVGGLIIAIDPTKEDVTTFSVIDKLHEGRMFESPDDDGIIIGHKLAEILSTKMGRKIVFTLTSKSGDIVSGMARVRGIIKTDAPSLDASLCLLPIDRARTLLGYDADEATQMAVFLTDHRDSQRIAELLDRRLRPEAAVWTWAQVKPDLAGFIAMKVSGLAFMEVLIILLITAGIFNTLFVSVMERLREFGILMAIGLTPGRLFRLVIWESVWLGLLGIATGATITAYPYYYLATTGWDLTALMGEQDLEVAGAAMEPLLKVAIYPENALMIAILVLLATVLSGLYPAWRAGRVVPVEAIKLV